MIAVRLRVAGNATGPRGATPRTGKTSTYDGHLHVTSIGPGGPPDNGQGPPPPENGRPDPATSGPPRPDALRDLGDGVHVGTGWPWDDLLDAGLRLHDADRRLLAAGTAGDAGAKTAAEWDREQAVEDYHRTRQRLADLFLIGLRAAAELHPQAVAVHIGLLPEFEVHRSAIRELEDALADAEVRIVELEDAVVNLEAQLAGVPA